MTLNKNNFKFLIILFFIMTSIPLPALDESPIKGNVLIFKIPQKNIEMNAISNESIKRINTVFDSLGRFLNVEFNRREWALKNVEKRNSQDIYKSISELLNVDIYIVINIFRRGSLIISEMKIVPLKKYYKELGSIIVVKSRIGINIPLKLSLEVAHLHKNLKLRASLTGRRGNNFYILNAGQWHGINTGTYFTLNGYKIEVVKTGRYRSLVKVPDQLVNKKNITISINPDYNKVVSRLNKTIRFNTLYQYGLGKTLLKGVDPEKKLLEGICVINTGANICLPGYGAFLSTRYLGFKSNSPSTTRVALSSGLILTHVLLPEVMTGFSINFFPGLDDDEKSERIRNLQYFLWATLPVTFTIAYFDQLAYLYNKKKFLPPFSDNMDEAALVFSLLFPGGGLFYKGYRLQGWAYYFTEMSLVGYGVYNSEDSKKFKYAFTIFGIVKLIELVNAYFINPSYKFYNMEMERGKKRSIFSFGINRGLENEGVYNFAVSIKY